MCVSKNLQIRGICISSALFLFYAPKFLKRPKIILSFLRYRCFNAKIPHRSAGFLPASFLSMQVGRSVIIGLQKSQSYQWFTDRQQEVFPG